MAPSLVECDGIRYFRIYVFREVGFMVMFYRLLDSIGSA
jgi:hypothetical protein